MMREAWALLLVVLVIMMLGALGAVAWALIIAGGFAWVGHCGERDGGRR